MSSTTPDTAKVIVLTGASSSIGEATARHLARQGHHLYIGARRLDRLTALQDELRAEGGHVEAMALDVTRQEDLQTIVAQAHAAHGRVDVLINNAGVMPLSPLATLKIDEWNRTLDVNVRGVLHGIAAVLPIMQAQGQGTSSTSHRLAPIRCGRLLRSIAPASSRCAPSPMGCARDRCHSGDAG